MEVANLVFELTKSFPREEMYSLTDQVRRSSRSVSAIVSEAWRRRKYKWVFVNKLNEAEGEAAETQTWLMHAVSCGYLSPERARPIHALLDEILAELTALGNKPDRWILKKTLE